MNSFHCLTQYSADWRFFHDSYNFVKTKCTWTIEGEGWRRHSSLILLILLFTKPNIEVSGWLYQTKTYFTNIVYQPFSRVSPKSFTLYDYKVDRFLTGLTAQQSVTTAWWDLNKKKQLYMILFQNLNPIYKTLV